MCLRFFFFSKEKLTKDRQDNVHCFPGSAVLVRENEPTSIIAYTLR